MIGRTSIVQQLLIITILAFGGAFAHAEDAGTPNKAYWMCKSKKQVRTIRVFISKQGVCTTYYQRDGSEKSVGSGKNHDSCMKFLDSIKRNLEKSNWSCRDISSTTITSVQE